MYLSDIKDDSMYKMAFDLTLKRPACVLLQAAMGCETNISHLFNTDSWLLAPTDGLRAYNLNGKQLKQAVAAVNSK